MSWPAPRFLRLSAPRLPMLRIRGRVILAGVTSRTMGGAIPRLRRNGPIAGHNPTNQERLDRTATDRSGPRETEQSGLMVTRGPERAEAFASGRAVETIPPLPFGLARYPVRSSYCRRYRALDVLRRPAQNHMDDRGKSNVCSQRKGFFGCCLK